MYLYKQFCYETIDDVASSILSASIQGDGAFVDSVTTYTSSIDINMVNRNQAWTYTYNPPSCSQLGFDNSFFGVTALDSVELAWMCSAVLIATWAVKTIRRAF